MATLYVREVPKDLHSRVKIQAIKEGMTLQAIVLKALEEYLERQGG
jgi:plasmid stability protein